MSKKCDNILLTLYLIIALLSLNKYIKTTSNFQFVFWSSLMSVKRKLNADDNMSIEAHTAQGSVCEGIQNSPEIELKFRPHALYDFIFAPHVSRTGVH